MKQRTGKDGSIKARNFYNTNGYDYATTAIKYPTFQGLTYSMNYINHSDAFSISRALTDGNNIYKLSNKETDSHLIKNSEWGAVSYLGQSQYGLNGTNIRINNLTLNNSEKTIYAVTGYAAKTLQDGDTKLEDARPVSSTEKVYKWTEKEGQTASCTGTIYGIYDMSGGTWERTAAIVNNGNDSGNLNTYGKAIMNALNNGKSSEYVTIVIISVLFQTVNRNTPINLSSFFHYISPAKFSLKSLHSCHHMNSRTHFESEFLYR